MANINLEKCIGCGLCVKKCVNKAIELFNGKAVVIDFLCLGCLLCQIVCPKEAVTVKPRSVLKSEEEKLRIQGALIKRQINLIKKRLG